MGTVLCSTIQAKVAILLQDATQVRWSEPETRGWLNAGQRELVLTKPDANIKIASMLLTASSTLQSAPADAFLFSRLSRNMGAGGTTPGVAITLADRSTMDTNTPTWHADAATGLIQHYIYDALDPRHFYVYPQAPSTAWYVEVVYPAIPTDCTSSSSAIALNDIYEGALTDYVLYRAYTKDAEFSGNAQLAVAHYTAFTNALK